MRIGKVLTDLRNKKHLTQDQMADALGVKRPRYNAWENDISNPDLEMVKKIAEFHKVSVDFILGHTENPEPTKPYYALTEKDERDIAKKLEEMMNDLDSKTSLSFMGEPMDEEDRELLRISLENALRMSREMAKKKFTPKKYRK